MISLAPLLPTADAAKVTQARRDDGSSFGFATLAGGLGVEGPTREEVLGAEVADAEPQDGKLVQAGDHILGEGQQAGQAVQLRVQAVAVPFGRVGLGTLSQGRFYPSHKDGRHNNGL